MRIAINITALENHDSTGYRYFVAELVKKMANSYPQDTIFLLTGKSPFFSQNLPQNVRTISMTLKVANWFLYKLRLKKFFFRVLKNVKADVFVSVGIEDRVDTHLPKCLLIEDAMWLQEEGKAVGVANYFKKASRYINKAERVMVLSEYGKNELFNRPDIEGQKVAVLPLFSDNYFQPIGFSEKEQVLNAYTEGKEYFVVYGSFVNTATVITILKAFSGFKKRLKSNFKLVLNNTAANFNSSLLDRINSYKYKEDVVLLSDLSRHECANIVAAGYASICVQISDFCFPMLEAMQCGTPVIAVEHPLAKEVAGEAALYYEADNAVALSEQMMWLYKEEQKRANLSQKGKERAQNFSIENTVNVFRTAIESAIG